MILSRNDLYPGELPEIEKRRADFFRDCPNAIRFNLVHLCPSMFLFSFAVFLLCCSTVLSGYCYVSFYFLGILGVMKLLWRHFAWHSPLNTFNLVANFIVEHLHRKSFATCCRNRELVKLYTTGLMLELNMASKMVILWSTLCTIWFGKDWANKYITRTGIQQMT